MAKRWTGLGLLLFFCLEGQGQVGKPRPAPVAPISIKTVPPDFYARRLSFFCRTELLLQKATGRPLFFRLGSKDYVDYLEQKAGARKP
ncbi:MAG: hypothetical protein EOO08_01635 [Chitinophagaceae bacterium]|nr:MAG: hypothetical protein EOO08_01635 [Chitinophagaceae bacterium]